MVCPECLGPIKRIQGGISKKGIKYSTFYACKNCEFTYNSPKPKEIKASLGETALLEDLEAQAFYQEQDEAYQRNN